VIDGGTEADGKGSRGRGDTEGDLYAGETLGKQLHRVVEVDPSRSRGTDGVMKKRCNT
jgi:hypothetical protein